MYLQLEMPDPMEINAPNNLQPEDEIIVAVLDTGIREDHPDFQVGIIIVSESLAALFNSKVKTILHRAKFHL